MIDIAEDKSLETERLSLRHLNMNDAPDVFEFGSDKETAYWGGFEPYESVDDCETLIFFCNLVPEYGYDLAITEKNADKVIGVISVKEDYDNPSNIVVGYFLSPDYTRRGYMSEALSAVCAKLFESEGIDSIELEIRADNIPSRGVARKCGFKQNENQTEWNLNHYGKPLDEFFLKREMLTAQAIS